jgi:uncharacterized membrane protein YczE
MQYLFWCLFLLAVFIVAFPYLIIVEAHWTALVADAFCILIGIVAFSYCIAIDFKEHAKKIEDLEQQIEALKKQISDS